MVTTYYMYHTPTQHDYIKSPITNTIPTQKNGGPQPKSSLGTPKTTSICRQRSYIIPKVLILNDRLGKYIDKYKITKKFTSYLCQWTLPNTHIYQKWLAQISIAMKQPQYHQFPCTNAYKVLYP